MCLVHQLECHKHVLSGCCQLQVHLQLSTNRLRDQFVRKEERSFNTQQKWMAVHVGDHNDVPRWLNRDPIVCKAVFLLMHVNRLGLGMDQPQPHPFTPFPPPPHSLFHYWNDATCACMHICLYGCVCAMLCVCCMCCVVCLCGSTEHVSVCTCVLCVCICVCVQRIYATCCMGNGTCVGKLCKAILNSWLPSSICTLYLRKKGTMA